MLQNPSEFDLTTDSPEYSKFIDDLCAEAEMLVALRHGNIVRFYGLCVDAITAVPKWIVVEQADCTLERYLLEAAAEGRHLTLDQFAAALGQLLCGLAYLHNHKPRAVIHRDLKLDNVFCFKHGEQLTVKIGDVGLARFTDAAGRLQRSTGGAVFYLAPEVLMGNSDGRADVFSLGIMMAEVVLCYLPVDGFPRVEHFHTRYGVPDRYAAVTEAVGRLRGLSPRLADLLQRCADKDVHMRPTAVLALKQLRELFGDALIPPTPVFEDDHEVCVQS